MSAADQHDGQMAYRGRKCGNCKGGESEAAQPYALGMRSGGWLHLSPQPGKGEANRSLVYSYIAQAAPFHRRHRRASRRTWRIVVLATHTPLTLVRPGPQPTATRVIMLSGPAIGAGVMACADVASDKAKPAAAIHLIIVFLLALALPKLSSGDSLRSLALWVVQSPRLKRLPVLDGCSHFQERQYRWDRALPSLIHIKAATRMERVPIV